MCGFLFSCYIHTHKKIISDQAAGKILNVPYFGTTKDDEETDF